MRIGKTQIYRCYDCNGVLLYAGISLSVMSRIGGHKNLARWFLKVKRIEIETKSTRKAALNKEAKIIEMEKPLHNKARNPLHKKKKQKKRGRRCWQQ